MDIKRAIWYLKDFGFNSFNSDFREAIVTVLAEYERLEKENQQLRDTRRYQNEI